MNQHEEINNQDSDDYQIYEKRSSRWPRVIVLGLLCLIGVALVAYSTFEIGSITMAYISGQMRMPPVLMIAALAAIALLVQLS